MKKRWVMVTAATMAIFLAACNGGSNAAGAKGEAKTESQPQTAEGKTEGETEETTAAAKAAPGDQIILKYAAAEVPGTPEYEANENFIKTVEEKSGGRIKIEHYHSSQLGNDKQVVMQALGGTLDIVKSSAGNLMDFSDALAFTDLPGLFKNQKHIRGVFQDQEIRNWVSEKVKEDIGLVPLNFDIDGGAARALFYNRANGAAKVPEDMKGLKLRTTGSEIEMALFEQWGAASVPMNFNELYLALQQGTVDGMYGHPIGTYGNKLCEVTNCCTIIDMSYIASVQLMSKSCMDKLGGEGSELYHIVAEAGKELEIYKDDLLNKKLETILDEIKETGTEIYFPDEAEMELWRASGQAVWDSYIGEGKAVPQEIVDKAMEIGNQY